MRCTEGIPLAPSENLGKASVLGHDVWERARPASLVGLEACGAQASEAYHLENRDRAFSIKKMVAEVGGELPFSI